MKHYLIGCDIGTGGTKAVLIDVDGRVLASHFSEYDLVIPRPGWAEQDPEWYWDATVTTIRHCLEEARVPARRVVGVGLSSLSPACILVDQDLAPLQHSHIWMDRRATDEAEWIREHVGDDTVFELTGNVIDPYYAIVKLMWEKRHRPQLYRRARAMLNAKDFCLTRLIGEPVTDWGQATLGGIAFDIRRKQWNEDILREIGLDPAKLPRAAAADEIVGTIQPEAARLTGLTAGTPVVAGTVDVTAAYLSLAAIDNGDNALTLGSSACFGLTVDQPRFVRGLVSLPHVVEPERKYLLCAVIVGGGSLLRWFRDQLGQMERMSEQHLDLDAYDLITLQAASAPPGSNGLMLLPYFMGERSPLWNPHVRGALLGLSFRHTRADLIRAFMEATGYAIYDSIDLIQRQGLTMNAPMGLVEGGAKSRLWRHIIADINGVPTAYIGSSGGAPLGDAVIAGVGTKAFTGYEVVRDWQPEPEIEHPHPAHHRRYQELFRMYRRFRDSLSQDFEALARIVQSSPDEESE